MKRLLDKLIRWWYVPRPEFEQVHQALSTARGLIIRHHDVSIPSLKLGRDCSVCCRKDGTSPKIDLIHAALDVRKGL